NNPQTASLGPDILERPRDRTRNNEVSASSLAFLFAEMVSYTQNRVSGISDLEKKLSLLGYRVGQRVLPLLSHRIEFPTPPSLSSGSSTYNRNPKRETRLLPVLLWLHTQLWKALFGKPADSLERSTEKEDEYMISTNTPLFAKSMSVPKEMSQLSVEAFTAGIIEAALDGLGFPARVTAHSVPTADQPLRTTILVKLHKEVMDREKAL
ncbi:TRAPP I complex, partial [Meira miltonrushii]